MVIISRPQRKTQRKTQKKNPREQPQRKQIEIDIIKLFKIDKT